MVYLMLECGIVVAYYLASLSTIVAVTSLCCCCATQNSHLVLFSNGYDIFANNISRPGFLKWSCLLANKKSPVQIPVSFRSWNKSGGWFSCLLVEFRWKRRVHAPDQWTADHILAMVVKLWKTTPL